MRVSGDESVAGQLRKTADGRIECDFPERMIMVANHQVRGILGFGIMADFGSYIRNGNICGGWRIRINPKCTATYTSC